MSDDPDRFADLRDDEIDLNQIDYRAWQIRNVAQMQRARHRGREIIEWVLLIALVLFCVWALTPW